MPAGTYNIDCHPGKGATGNPITSFPSYYENNFTVSSDTTKNIVVGSAPTATATPTSPPTAAPIQNSSPATPTSGTTNTPAPTPQPTTPNQAVNQQKTLAPTYAINPQTQPDENSLGYWILLIVIAGVSVIAVMTLIWGYRGKQAVIDATNNPKN